MNVQQSLVLGIIQGLTEFLPISSTAHLILVPKLFSTGLEPRAEIRHTYETIIQSGTLLAVLVYFWRDWLNMAKAAAGMAVRRKIETLDERMVVYLVLGSIPAGILGLLFESKVEDLAQPEKTPIAYLVLGGALVIFGIVMWLVEAGSKRTRDLEHVRMPDALLIGFAQALALIPGVSRSGATMTAGLAMGFTRDAAARFSFLLSTPIMLAATGYKLLKVFKGPGLMTSDEMSGMLLATVVAAISGYFAIWGLLKWLRTRPLWVFSIYRIAVGAFVIGFYFYQQR